MRKTQLSPFALPGKVYNFVAKAVAAIVAVVFDTNVQRVVAFDTNIQRVVTFDTEIS